MSVHPIAPAKSLLIAFASSFAVYLIPLFNVHAGLVPLGLLWVGLADPSALTLAMAAGAVSLQAMAGALIYWASRNFRWRRGLALAVAVPIFVVGGNFLILVAVPLTVLVENDPRPETGELTWVCSLPDASLAQVRSGVDLGLERAGEAWIDLHDGWSRGILTMPGCRAESVLTGGRGSSVDHVAPGGHLLFATRQGGLAYLGPGLETPRALPAPTNTRFWSPTLSEDGRFLAWLDRGQDASGGSARRVRLRGLADGLEETIPLETQSNCSFTLIGAAPAHGRYTIACHRNQILVFDNAGKLVGRPVSPAGLHDTSWGFRHLANGWIAWDEYREEGRYRVVWSLPAGDGEATIPRGRRIQSLAASPDGGLIAVSMESSLSVGGTRAAVFLIRTTDGLELFRRYYPKNERVRLAFLGNEFLAMTRNEEGRGFIDVYRIPGILSLTSG